MVPYVKKGKKPGNSGPKVGGMKGVLADHFRNKRLKKKKK